MYTWCEGANENNRRRKEQIHKVVSIFLGYEHEIDCVQGNSINPRKLRWRKQTTEIRLFVRTTK